MQTFWLWSLSTFFLFRTKDGVKETGVSLAFTVRALDAGPVIAYERLEIDDQIKVSSVYVFRFHMWYFYFSEKIMSNF